MPLIPRIGLKTHAVHLLLFIYQVRLEGPITLRRHKFNIDFVPLLPFPRLVIITVPKSEE